jgi:DNA gyrase subunit A
MSTITMTERKGQLAAMKIVMPEQEMMIVSEEGVVIRVKSNDISQLGRATQGVRVMNVGDTDRVCAVARVASAKKKRAAAMGLEGQEALFENGKQDDEDNGFDEDVADEADDFDEAEEGDVEDGAVEAGEAEDDAAGADETEADSAEYEDMKEDEDV